MFLIAGCSVLLKLHDPQCLYVAHSKFYFELCEILQLPASKASSSSGVGVPTVAVTDVWRSTEGTSDEELV